MDYILFLPDNRSFQYKNLLSDNFIFFSILKNKQTKHLTNFYYDESASSIVLNTPLEQINIPFSLQEYQSSLLVIFKKTLLEKYADHLTISSFQDSTIISISNPTIEKEIYYFCESFFLNSDFCCSSLKDHHIYISPNNNSFLALFDKILNYFPDKELLFYKVINNQHILYRCFFDSSSFECVVVGYFDDFSDLFLFLEKEFPTS